MVFAPPRLVDRARVNCWNANRSLIASSPRAPSPFHPAERDNWAFWGTNEPIRRSGTRRESSYIEARALETGCRSFKPFLPPPFFFLILFFKHQEISQRTTTTTKSSGRSMNDNATSNFDLLSSQTCSSLSPSPSPCYKTASSKREKSDGRPIKLVSVAELIERASIFEPPWIPPFLLLLLLPFIGV